MGCGPNPEALRRWIMMTNVLLLVLLLARMCVAFSQSYDFYFVLKRMSWPEAQTYCRQNYADLATVNGRLDLDELVRSVDQRYTGNVWIGLYRSNASAPWIWSDQSKSTFMPWSPNQPNNVNQSQYCVELFNRSSLNDLDCSTKLPSVCYTKESKHTTMRLRVKSSENVNDPSVKAGILLELEQILEEKGLTEVKFSWKIQSDGNVFQQNQKCHCSTDVPFEK